MVVDHDAGRAARRLRALPARATAPPRSSWSRTAHRGAPRRALARAPDRASAPGVRGADPGRNLGYGAGANRGLAVLAGLSPRRVGARLQPRPASSTRGARRPGARPRRAPAWPWWGRGSSTAEGRSTPRCAASPPSSTPPATPCSPCSDPDNPFTRRYNPGTPEGEGVVEAGLGVGLLLPGPAGAPSRSWVASTSPTSCTPRTWTCAGGPTRPGGASGSAGAASVTHVAGGEHGAGTPTR